MRGGPAGAPRGGARGGGVDVSGASDGDRRDEGGPPQERDEPELWAMVELFGQGRLVGRVTEEEIGGVPFLRIEVPPARDLGGYTKLLSPKAIYAITLIEERDARAVAFLLAVPPLRPLQLQAPPRRALEAPRGRAPAGAALEAMEAA